MDIVNKTLLLGSKVSKAAKDGWENIFTGLGTSKDKRTGNQVKRNKTIQTAVEVLHDSDDIAQMAVNEVPDRGTSKWLKHSVSKEEGGIDQVNKIVDEEKRLQLKKKVNKGWKWSRLYGGAAIFISVDDGQDLDKPLNLNRIVKVNSLTVLHRYELQRGRICDDINSPNFGLPDEYTLYNRVGSNVQLIHHSRIVRFDGAPLSAQEFINNDYWNDSVLNILADVIRDYNGAYAGISHAMQDFDVSILKLKNLADIIGADDDDLVVSRLKLMNLAKSIMGSVLIDAEEEEFTNMSRQFTNVDKVLEKMDQRLVMAMKMPHTVVLGNGSTGTLGASGESENNNMNSLVSAQQDEVIKDPLEYIYEVIQAAKQGPTNGKILKSHSWVFNPLSEPSGKEVAETRKLVSESDKNYFEIGSLSSQEISESRFGGDEYSMETIIDTDARKEQSETSEIDPDETKKIMKGIDK